jgi:hypothetical protein
MLFQKNYQFEKNRTYDKEEKADASTKVGPKKTKGRVYDHLYKWQTKKG